METTRGTMTVGDLVERYPQIRYAESGDEFRPVAGIGRSDQILVNDGWFLDRHDADPVRFPADIENGATDVLWQFKWMSSSLRSSLAFALEQISAVRDDMERHYRAAGLGINGVLMARSENAHAAGRLDEVERCASAGGDAPRLAQPLRRRRPESDHGVLRGPGASPTRSARRGDDRGRVLLRRGARAGAADSPSSPTCTRSSRRR